VIDLRVRGADCPHQVRMPAQGASPFAWELVLGAVSCGVKNDTIAGFGDPADLYTVKMRQ